MVKNEIYKIKIEDIGNDGEGIGHVTDRQSGRSIAVFVKDTVIGDVADIKIIKCKKSYAYGRLMELIKPSPYRVDAVCPNARSCGGCSLMHMSYEKQLDYKWNKVKSCMERIGGFRDVESIMEPVCGMDKPYNYRNKMQFPVGQDKDGNIQIGFYAGRTHSIIDMASCAIGHPVNDYIIKCMRKWLELWQTRTENFIYDEKAHKGLVRHILTRVGFITGELMVCVVINGSRLPHFGGEDGVMELVEGLKNAVDEYNRGLDKRLRDNVTGCNRELGYGGDKMEEDAACRKISLTSVCLNINREKTNKILGDKCVTVWGKDYISDYIGDIKFNISPLSFYQVNPRQTRVLYDKAVEYAGLSGNETVWDMYCGIGTISLCLAKKARQVYGVEIVPQAIEDAKVNAGLNGFDNTKFFCGKAEEIVPAFYDGRLKQAEIDGNDNKECGIYTDVVVVDPPRKGCDSVLLDTICRMSPKRIVYVSCDPATLARDAKYLADKGFKLDKITVVDQFGHSAHVETVCLLSKKNQ